MILYIMGGSAVTLVIIVLIYFILSKKMQGSEYRKIQKLQQGTKPTDTVKALIEKA